MSKGVKKCVKRRRRLTDRTSEILRQTFAAAMRDLAQSDKTILEILGGMQTRMDERDRQFFKLKDEGLGLLTAQLLNEIRNSKEAFIAEVKGTRADFITRFADMATRLDKIEKGGHSAPAVPASEL